MGANISRENVSWFAHTGKHDIVCMYQAVCFLFKPTSEYHKFRAFLDWMQYENNLRTRNASFEAVRKFEQNKR